MWRSSNPLSWRIADLKHDLSGPKVMSTFSCGGGSSMGYKMAGYHVVAANDIDGKMQDHYEANLRPPDYFLCPVGELSKAAKDGELPDHLYKLDLLDGSPPCSAFSMAGSREKVWGKEKHFREGQSTQVLDDLFFDYLDLLGALRPKASISENVRGMLNGNARGYVTMIAERYKELGYRPQLFLVNAADCGVPQRRERVFFVALRDDIDKPPLQFKPSQKWIPLREAWEDVPPYDLSAPSVNNMKPLWALGPPKDLYPSAEKCWHIMRRGENWSRTRLRSLGVPGHDSNYRAHWDMTVGTFAAANNIWHPDEPRFMTAVEAARISSFPDDYLATSTTMAAYMMGMSVPPKMMQAVSTAVKEQWL